MDTEERVKQAIELFGGTDTTDEFDLYLQELKEEDPLAFSVVEVYILTLKCQYPSALRRGIRLISRMGGQPWLTWRLFMSISLAYTAMGEMETGETYLVRALEIAELIGDRESIFRTRLRLSINKFLRAEYDLAGKELLSLRKDPEAWKPYRIDYFLGICVLIKGQPEKAIGIFDSLLETEKGGRPRFDLLEMKALALRITGKLHDAMETFLKSAMGQVDHETGYSAFVVAKALELSRLSGLEPPSKDLIKKALSLAKRGSWGEQAAVQEIEALLVEDDSGAADGLYEAAKNYLRAYQNIEALFSGLTAAYLAWKADSSVFTKAIKLVAPLVLLHSGFKKDPLLGGFMSEMDSFLRKALKPSQDKGGIKAYLLGELRVIVDEREINLRGWRNSKAIKGLIYLLLSPKHRIPSDHLFYLLWPRMAYNDKTRYYLYNAIATIRRNLGRSELLIRMRDFYQLEEVWTDLGEIENLLRLADATHDPQEKEEYLARARELARGELLPEFPYDRHIEEYRQYYKRLRKRLLGR